MSELSGWQSNNFRLYEFDSFRGGIRVGSTFKRLVYLNMSGIYCNRAINKKAMCLLWDNNTFSNVLACLLFPKYRNVVLVIHIQYNAIFRPWRQPDFGGRTPGWRCWSRTWRSSWTSTMTTQWTPTISRSWSSGARSLRGKLSWNCS